jgi:YegS/Rv2252/BmrU family lipid kinase
MKHLFIVNPKAGSRNRTVEVEARVKEAFLYRDEPYEIYLTKGPLDAAEKVRTEAEKGEPLRVYACGGDGTFNECFCGAVNHDNVAVCPFPLGTGNDFCRAFGEDRELFRDLYALLDGTEESVDVIDCNGRYSANICSVGIDARIGTSVHDYSSIPLCDGPIGYVVSLVANVIKGISTKMKITCGDFQAEVKHALVCACNGRFYGGGFNPSLDASINDGLLEILVVKDVSLPRLALLLGKYASGHADDLPRYITHLRGTEITIELEKPDVINIDGEAITADRIHIQLLPKAAKIVVPRGCRHFPGTRS